MKNPLLAAAIAAALSFGSAAHAASNDELAQIRSQLQSLMQRVDKLEAENNSLKSENDQLKAQTEQVSKQMAQSATQGADLKPAPAAVKAADWPSRVVLKGDVRYRHQQTDDDNASAKREEDLLRARLGVEAKVNDSIVAAIGVSTTSAPGNPRGGNVQLDGAFSRKSLYLDLAYFDWTFADNAHFIAGKMKMPFVRPGQSLFWDNDINPEGIALTYSAGSMFGSAWSYWLEENVQTSATTTTATDTKMYGLQLGNRFDIGGNNLVVAASYYDLAAAEGRRPFYNNSPNGNSLTVSGGLAYDFQVVDLMAEYNFKLRDVPFQVWADVARNLDAEYDTAFTMGTMVGKASNPGTWETGLAYQLIEKDALFAQHIDSDFGGGLSDSDGWVLRTGYAPAKNWVLNATYFKNANNKDVGTEYDFDRLMLDFNTRF
ncbi:putative porin [Peristeroidobacter agariperforans]|uniref:putative porin n=1 Tax=Peristeroidobacter agariperforans TaxID=268404 RepID=UPI0018E50D29|nr:putative porin [Peristeroidobacter agariperforans]